MFAIAVKDCVRSLVMSADKQRKTTWILPKCAMSKKLFGNLLLCGHYGAVFTITEKDFLNIQYTLVEE